MIADNLGQQGHQRQIGRPQHQNPGDNIIQIFGGLFARTDARDKAVLVFQVFGHFIGLEGNFAGIEIGEKHDHPGKEHQIQRLARTEVSQNR